MSSEGRQDNDIIGTKDTFAVTETGAEVQHLIVDIVTSTEAN